MKNALLILILSNITMGCVTMQQPLPGSLWGDWAFIQTGTIINGSKQKLYDYRNECDRNSDQLRFSSDSKVSLRWYDEHCAIQEYLIGRYYVEGSRLKVNLAKSSPYQDSPFPPITEYRIIQITPTTLTLEEIPDEYKRQKYHGKPSGSELTVFIFSRVE
ncbi:hypothetical protein [Aequorivita sp. CIP111184]|uniref:hypothetical protein n=1 Tax=Aequorivita sp. CIP111184 TaxID=2211356 RepID=UPI00215C0636|nr:hypothetical protein [Aequorivita sp. CIP111184]